VREDTSAFYYNVFSNRYFIMPERTEAKTILNKKKQRDSWFLDDYTVNPYSGCSFNCLYCYIRGSKYGIHMEEKLTVKTNAVELLDKQLALRAKKNQFGIIVLSSATDPYLLFEKEEKLTRRMLEVILKHRFPVHIITKSDLVLRDLDLLKHIDEVAILPSDLHDKLSHKVFITFSFSTLDDAVAKIFEPGATLPSLRLETMKACIERGFFSGVSMMPLLPYISDTAESLNYMLKTFKGAKANHVFPATITLFGEGPADSKTLVFRAIEKHYPHLLVKYQKYFSNGNQLPHYYNLAFNKKIKEMMKEYGLKARIV
jgi:DNA repair photolyase